VHKEVKGLKVQEDHREYKVLLVHKEERELRGQEDLKELKGQQDQQVTRVLKVREVPKEMVPYLVPVEDKVLREHEGHRVTLEHKVLKVLKGLKD